MLQLCKLNLANTGRNEQDSQTFNIEDIWDIHTINNIKSLHPAIRDSVTKFILDAQSKGINLRITSGFRSIDEQNTLFAQGRTTSRKYCY